jgi:hypothetical protein
MIQFEDWRQIGEADARAGYPDNRVANHNKACEKLGIKVDPATYQSGYAIGLRAFCITNEAFELGRRGASYLPKTNASVQKIAAAKFCIVRGRVG